MIPQNRYFFCILIAFSALPQIGEARIPKRTRTVKTPPPAQIFYMKAEDIEIGECKNEASNSGLAQIDIKLEQASYVHGSYENIASCQAVRQPFVQALEKARGHQPAKRIKITLQDGEITKLEADMVDQHLIVGESEIPRTLKCSFENDSPFAAARPLDEHGCENLELKFVKCNNGGFPEYAIVICEKDESGKDKAELAKDCYVKNQQKLYR